MNTAFPIHKPAVTSRIARAQPPHILWIILIAFIARAGAMVLFQTYVIPADRDHWTFAYETGRIARSIVLGHGYASPLPEPTGPTGSLPPAYPFLLALIFRVFGIYTTAAACAVYLLQTSFSVLSSVAIWKLGVRVFGPWIGWLSALAYAVYPPAIWHSISTIWNTSLLTFGFLLLVTYLYDLPTRPRAAQMICAGLLMGSLLLVDAAPGVVYPAIAVWLWKRIQPSVRLNRLAIACAVCGITLLPWMIRNAIVMRQFMPRTIAGMALRVGNSEGAWRAGEGRFDASLHAADSPVEFERYKRLGEAGYERWSREIAIQQIRQNPSRFAVMTWRRVFAWWFGQSNEWAGNLHTAARGLGLVKRAMVVLPLPFLLFGMIRSRRSEKPAGLLVAILLLYPIPYYFLFVNERYRFPTDGFMILIAVYGAAELLRIFRERGTDSTRVVDAAPRKLPAGA
ncbi:MAG TPA: glycosyltransferase family 39 protein [Bryobacteraceae bacterium]|nr:glycosyltransferase family 39 protein [Bryobacteraceae bacterium]